MVGAISLRVAVRGVHVQVVPTFVVSVNFAHGCRLLVLYRVEIGKDERNRDQAGRGGERRREVDSRHPCTSGLPTHEGQ